MKKGKIGAVLLSLMVGLGGLTAASAEAVYDGKVIAAETVTVLAPYGGMLKSIDLREGEWVDAGDAVASIETNKVFATEDGIVRGIALAPGDAADGTVLYLSPVNKYTITANLEKAYSSVDTKYVRLGEQVYISCSKDGTHKAVGIVKAIKGAEYTVETTGGELYMEETVYIYRDKSYHSKTRIGSGTVSRTAEIAVAGKGSLLKLHVEEGDEVEKGQLLFETVEGTIDEMTEMGSDILSPVSGVVASVKAKVGAKVEKAGVMMTIYPRSAYQIEMTVPEDMLSSLSEGDEVSIYFNWNEDESNRYLGTIESISYMSAAAQSEGSSGTDSGQGSAANGDASQDAGNKMGTDSSSDEVTYSAYVVFEADENVRVGMNATIITQ